MKIPRLIPRLTPRRIIWYNLIIVWALSGLAMYCKFSSSQSFDAVMLGFLLGWLNHFFYNDQMDKLRKLQVTQ